MLTHVCKVRKISGAKCVKLLWVVWRNIKFYTNLPKRWLYSINLVQGKSQNFINVPISKDEKRDRCAKCMVNFVNLCQISFSLFKGQTHDKKSKSQCHENSQNFKNVLSSKDEKRDSCAKCMVNFVTLCKINLSGNCSKDKRRCYITVDFRNGCVTKRSLHLQAFHSQENQYYADFDKKY